jgi:hypothetical protein
VVLVRTDERIATANVLPSFLILCTLMMEIIRFSETSVLTTAKWRHIPEDGIPMFKVFQNTIFDSVHHSYL